LEPHLAQCFAKHVLEVDLVVVFQAVHECLRKFPCQICITLAKEGEVAQNMRLVSNIDASIADSFSELLDNLIDPKLSLTAIGDSLVDLHALRRCEDLLDWLCSSQECQ